MKPQSLFDKLWSRRVVVDETTEAPAVLYIDLHLIHEVTSPQAFTALEERGLKVRRPDRTLATLDHSTPTLPATALDPKSPLRSSIQRRRNRAGKFFWLIRDMGRIAMGAHLPCRDAHPMG